LTCKDPSLFFPLLFLTGLEADDSSEYIASLSLSNAIARVIVLRVVLTESVFADADRMKRQLILAAEQKLLAAKAQLTEAKQVSHDLNQTGLANAAAVDKRKAVKVDRAVSPQTKKEPAAAEKPKLGFFGKRKDEKDKKKDKK
jgi:hypothetical protein